MPSDTPSDTPSGPPTVWTPVALSRDLPAGTSTGVVCDGAEIVLWRDTAGTLHAWEDRCPHRGMKLSFGFVRGDRIACLYHGWEYGHDAVCRYIPAHPDLQVPSSIRVARHSVTERSGMAWVAAQDTPATMPEGLATLTPLRSVFVDAPLPVVKNLLMTGGLPGAGPVADATTEGAQVRFLQRDLSVLAGLHAETAGRTGVHLVLEGTVTAEVCAALIPATAALRRAAQNMGQQRGAA